MKKLISIFLVGLLLYNMMGFSIVYWIGLENPLQRIESVPQATKSEQEFIVVKIPVSLPYQNDWKTAIPAEGSIHQDGRFYQIVSQQLVNDTLYTVCKPDINARDRFFDLAAHINDHIKQNSNTSGKSSENLLKSLIKDYMVSRKTHVFFVFEWLVPKTVPSFRLPVIAVHLFVESPPPEFA